LGELVARFPGGAVAADAELTAVRVADELPPGLIDPLTDSETRILGYPPTRLTAQEIAIELSLSVHTVTTHMRHLYAKLGVHRRRQAVEHARALGLLAPIPQGS
jgi:LuxR family transcriptional regulator, maltose regulon positive regulatory protein